MPKTAPLTDSYVANLPMCSTGQYIVRDTVLPGFFVVVGKSSKAFTVQMAVKLPSGKRSSKRRVVGRFGELSTRAARTLAKQSIAETSIEEIPAHIASPIRLSAAWEYYQRFLNNADRSDRTVAGYQKHIELYFTDWLGKDLIELAHHPEIVVSRHEALTKNNGPYAANSAMRTFSAIYNNAARTHLELRGLNPVEAVRFNKEHRRKTALTPDDLPKWLEQLERFENKIRRHFHIITLVTGSRPDALKRARWNDINFEKRTWHFPSPKGGIERAFDLPIGDRLNQILRQLQKDAQLVYPAMSQEFVFPADSPSGFISETKERRTKLTHWGNDLRQSFRTFATMAGITELYIRILMNHKVRDVSVGYLNLLPIWQQLSESQDQMIVKLDTIMGKPVF